ncbi:MAG: hypothetical protein K2Q10_09405, partial [Rhodospirillales bacterium]|nr:hypothetical protein [Rhodospirillales bacterium]
RRRRNASVRAVLSFGALRPPSSARQPEGRDKTEAAMMTRRGFLSTGAAAGFAAFLPAVRAQALLTPPAGLIPIEQLPVRQVDVPASNASGKLMLKGGGVAGRGSRWGMVVEIPPEPITAKLLWTAEKNMVPGVRLVLRGMKGPNGERPLLRGVVEVRDHTRGAIGAGLDLEGFDIEGDKVHDTVSSTLLRWVGLKDMRIRGGRNGLKLAPSPSLLSIVDSEIWRAAMGSGLYHNTYVNYVEAVEAVNTRFLSPWSDSNCFKCYAADVKVRGCTFANWWTEEDRQVGAVGGNALAEIGSWGNTVFIDNTLVRRMPMKPFMLEFRNRIWQTGFDRYVPYWGIEPANYHSIDNSREDDPRLYRHLVARNHFVNGVLPDGSLDPGVRAKPGVAVLHGGTCVGWTSGLNGRKAKDGLGPTPPDWDIKHDRAIVYLAVNTQEGVPLESWYSNHPVNHPQDPTPVRELSEVPNWAG